MKKIKVKHFTTFVFPEKNIIELSYIDQETEEEVIIEIHENIAGFIRILESELERKLEDN